MSFFHYHELTKTSLLQIEPATFDPATIARVLSRTHRFRGWSKTPWNVADHSVCVARRLLKSDGLMAARWGLMHDAAEIHVGDVPTPLKNCLQYTPPDGDPWRLAMIEFAVLRAVARRFALPWPMPECVAVADKRQLASEIAYLFDELDPAQYAAGFQPWTPEEDDAETEVEWPLWWMQHGAGSHPNRAEDRWLRCYADLFDRTTEEPPVNG